MTDSDTPADAEVSTKSSLTWLRVPIRVLVIAILAFMAYVSICAGSDGDWSGWLQPVGTGQGGTHNGTMPEAL